MAYLTDTIIFIEYQDELSYVYIQSGPKNVYTLYSSISSE